MKRGIMILVGLVALTLIGGAGYFGFHTTQTAAVPTPSAPQTVPVTRGDVRQTVSAPGQLVATRQVDLALDAGCRLAGVAVRPGDRVQEGDVLARLETSDLEQAVTRAGLDLRQAQLRLEQLQEPADEAEIRRAQHAVAQAADTLGVARIDLSSVLSSTLLNRTLEDAQSAFQDAKNWHELRLRQHEEEGLDYWFVDQAQKRYKDAQLNLARVQYGADQQLESAHSQANKARHTYKEAQDGLQQLLEGADPADLEAAQLDVEKARADLEKATLVAPFDGVVLEVNGAPGDRISAGATLITLIDPTAVEAKVTVIEEDLPLIEAGQPVELFFDARPEVIVQGHVARIVPQRVTGTDRPLYPVYIALDELPEGLAPGMTVDGSITIAERTDGRAAAAPCPGARRVRWRRSGRGVGRRPRPEAHHPGRLARRRVRRDSGRAARRRAGSGRMNGIRDTQHDWVIEAEGLTKVYRMGATEVHALREVDLRVRAGEFLALMGASGSGKSTLMHLLGCLDTPTAGCYHLEGQDVSTLSNQERARVRNTRIGFVFQSFNLLPRLDALENVMLPLLYRGRVEDAEKRAAQALERVGLAGRTGHRPTELSGGEQQRVAIARALAPGPAIILADEPTGNLDSATGADIIQLLVELWGEGRTILMVTHDAQVAAHAQRILRVRDGRILNERSGNDVP